MKITNISQTLNPEPNVYKSMLTLDSEKYPLNGTYFCIGENSEGIGEDSITINVRDKMKLLEGFTGKYFLSNCFFNFYV